MTKMNTLPYMLIPKFVLFMYLIKVCKREDLHALRVVVVLDLAGGALLALSGAIVALTAAATVAGNGARGVRR